MKNSHYHTGTNCRLRLPSWVVQHISRCGTPLTPLSHCSRQRRRKWPSIPLTPGVAEVDQLGAISIAPRRVARPDESIPAGRCAGAAEGELECMGIRYRTQCYEAQRTAW